MQSLTLGGKKTPLLSVGNPAGFKDLVPVRNRAGEAGLVLSHSETNAVRDLFSVQVLQVWGAAGSGDG